MQLQLPLQPTQIQLKDQLLLLDNQNELNDRKIKIMAKLTNFKGDFRKGNEILAKIKLG